VDADQPVTGGAPAGGDAIAVHGQPVIAALAGAARLGAYFTVTAGAAEGAWRPAAAAGRLGLPGLVSHTAQQLGVSETRVAVSIAQLGYAARLWSPGLACALQHGIVPDLRGLQLSAQPPARLRVPRPAGWRATGPAAAARLLYHTVVEEQLEPLTAGLRAGLAAGLLWGNAASAMAGALGVIARADPALAAAGEELGSLLLSTGHLRGTGFFTGPGPAFRRRSCCLYYRVPGGGLCGDCSLAR
jgi:hypothetical protein